MSTHYALKTEVKVEELFDGRLERFGISECVKEDTTQTHRCLTDGSSFLWFAGNNKVKSATCDELDFPGKILGVIACIFNTEIISEYDPQEWEPGAGLSWRREWQNNENETEANFYDEIMKFIRGESHNIRPGSVGIYVAGIARAIIAGEPLLASPKCESVLMEEVLLEWYSR